MNCAPRSNGQRDVWASRESTRSRRAPDDPLLVNFAAGAIAGSTSAILTAPLELAKTRLQSAAHGYSHGSGSTPPSSMSASYFRAASSSQPSSGVGRIRMGFQPVGGVVSPPSNYGHFGLFNNVSLCCVGCQQQQQQRTVSRSVLLKQQSNLQTVRGSLRELLAERGCRGLFRGLPATLAGVAPSCGIYFCSYYAIKQRLIANHLELLPPAGYHFISALGAAFIQHSLTNPIWYVKTRLQLDTALTVRQLLKTTSLPTFWKGLSASYLGMPETIIKWVLYEDLKARLPTVGQESTIAKFAYFMVAAGGSKVVAASICYPHEVLRTRLREAGQSAQRLLPSLMAIWREGALYRGLVPHLICKAPNTAVMFVVYEVGISLVRRYYI